jgi:hypothetical protein
MSFSPRHQRLLAL